MATALAQVLRHFGPTYLGEHRLSTPQAKAWRAIVACRTAALGGQQLACDGCGAPQWRWHSCRNRHCPQCQSRAREAWRSARLAQLLNVPYCHLVFTLPHELNALAGLHPRWVYDTLMQCTAATLTEFAANPRWLGGTCAFTLVLPHLDAGPAPPSACACAHGLWGLEVRRAGQQPVGATQAIPALPVPGPGAVSSVSGQVPAGAGAG